MRPLCQIKRLKGTSRTTPEQCAALRWLCTQGTSGCSIVELKAAAQGINDEALDKLESRGFVHADRPTQSAKRHTWAYSISRRGRDHLDAIQALAEIKQAEAEQTEAEQTEAEQTPNTATQRRASSRPSSRASSRPTGGQIAQPRSVLHEIWRAPSLQQIPEPIYRPGAQDFLQPPSLIGTERSHPNPITGQWSPKAWVPT